MRAVTKPSKPRGKPSGKARPYKSATRERNRKPRLGPLDTELKGELRVFGGSRSDDFNQVLLGQVASSLWPGHEDEQERIQQKCAAYYAMAGIKPKDELEGMIAAQLVACHYASMDCYRRAAIENQTLQGRQENLNQANKLSRTYAMLVETLNRHRGKGQQKVTVEHVHVHEGGQAIVGNIETQGGESSTRSEGLPHAKQIAHAPGTPLPSPDTTRDGMSVASDVERSVPDARRDVTRPPEGE
jgi:hypothetical protein